MFLARHSASALAFHQDSHPASRPPSSSFDFPFGLPLGLPHGGLTCLPFVGLLGLPLDLLVLRITLFERLLKNVYVLRNGHSEFLALRDEVLVGSRNL